MAEDEIRTYELSLEQTASGITASIPWAQRQANGAVVVRLHLQSPRHSAGELLLNDTDLIALDPDERPLRTQVRRFWGYTALSDVTSAHLQTARFDAGFRLDVSATDGWCGLSIAMIRTHLPAEGPRTVGGPWVFRFRVADDQEVLVARQETARQEAARQEAARLEAERQENARREAAQREAERQERIQQQRAERQAQIEEAQAARQAAEAAARQAADSRARADAEDGASIRVPVRPPRFGYRERESARPAERAEPDRDRVAPASGDVAAESRAEPAPEQPSQVIEQAAAADQPADSRSARQAGGRSRRSAAPRPGQEQNPQQEPNLSGPPEQAAARATPPAEPAPDSDGRASPSSGLDAAPEPDASPEVSAAGEDARPAQRAPRTRRPRAVTPVRNGDAETGTSAGED